MTNDVGVTFLNISLLPKLIRYIVQYLGWKCKMTNQPTLISSSQAEVVSLTNSESKATVKQKGNLMNFKYVRNSQAQF
jgi:hypothetical protein